MKKTVLAIAVSLLLVAALAFFTRYYFYMNEDNSNNDIKELSDEDSRSAELLLNKIVSNLSLFEERYYAYLSDKSLDGDFDSLLVSNPFDKDNFTSKTVFSEIDRLIDYVNNVMKLKLVVADSGFNIAAYGKYFSSIEFNYISAAASLEVLSEDLNLKRPLIFIPDEISLSVIDAKKCFTPTSTDSYEESVRWYIENTSVRAAFDKNFFKVLFGRDVYNRYELQKIYKEMKKLYTVIPECGIPTIFQDMVPAKEYKAVLDLYQDKLTLVKYIAYNEKIDPNLIINAIMTIYNAKSFNSIVSSGLGMNSFNTLGDLALFELYSKSYETNRESEKLPIH